MNRALIQQPALLALLLLATVQASAQDYTYDPNSNMVADATKKIACIHYNQLNLDTIIYEDCRKIIQPTMQRIHDAIYGRSTKAYCHIVQ